MATHKDLLDAITRVRAAGGGPDSWTAGLTGADIAVVTNPLSSPGAVGAVLAKLIAAHPDAFLTPSSTAAEPEPIQGATADAIRGAESALAEQNSQTAEADLQVLGAVRDAHGTHAQGISALDGIKREIEHAALTRTDLDTPAGARAFQRYLVDRLRDIRDVVGTAEMDAASKAALTAAVAALYASDTAGSEEPDRVGAELDRLLPCDEDLGPLLPSDEDLGRPLPADSALAPAGLAGPPMGLPPMSPLSGGWGGGVPGGAPFGAGMPMPASGLPVFDPPTAALDDGPRRAPRPDPLPDSLEPDPESVSAADGPSDEEAGQDDGTVVELPGGQIVAAPSPQVAAAMTAAVGGMPIKEAFEKQGIALPEAGSPVTDPVPPEDLLPGDIGMLTDRHALALGNGTALLDQQIQSLARVMGPGFLGWQHPPAAHPETTTVLPDPPATETAPS